MTSDQAQKFFEVGKRYYVTGDHFWWEGVCIEINRHAVTLDDDPEWLRPHHQRRGRCGIGFAGNLQAQLVPDPSVQLAGALVADAIEAALRKYDGVFDICGALREIATAIRPPSPVVTP